MEQSPFKKRYTDTKDIFELIPFATDVKDIANLYYINAKLVEENPELKQTFSDKKDEFFKDSSKNNY